MTIQEPQTTKGAAVSAAYPRVSALPTGKAFTLYPATRIGSTEYAARLIASRFAVSPVTIRDVAS